MEVYSYNTHFLKVFFFFYFIFLGDRKVCAIIVVIAENKLKSYLINTVTYDMTNAKKNHPLCACFISFFNVSPLDIIRCISV